MSGPRGRILVTGGAGFIGSHLVDLLLERGAEVVVLDKLTYAGDPANLERHGDDPRLQLVRGDVADPVTVERLVRRSDHVIHAAAESFVDRSIADSAEFVRSNVLGTQVVLESCRAAGRRLLHVSTDEVYGQGAETGAFDEDAPLRPRSPYAASKAAADLLCRSYVVTHGLPVTVARGTNAYGPRQHPEKAVPTFALAALSGRPVPVYGDGRHRREWLFVTDWARALVDILEAGEPGGVYNIGGGYELTNLELARSVCELAGAPASLVTSVPDRPGHDLRYGLTWDRLAALGWRPEVPFEEGLARTVAWYRDRAADREGVAP